MQAGDRIYYTHVNANGLKTKFPAVVVDVADRKIHIRIGRLDVLTQKIVTKVFPVDADQTAPRETPCNYEDELCGTGN